MCISTKESDMLYLIFISTQMVLKEKFGVTNVYIYKNIRHVVFNVYICTYGFERKKLLSSRVDLFYESPGSFILVQKL